MAADAADGERDLLQRPPGTREPAWSATDQPALPTRRNQEHQVGNGHLYYCTRLNLEC